MAKYKKCPRCELNYILEGEDYCYVCKSEMKHHAENEDMDLLDIEDMELCPICGQNYITEDQTMCDECKGKSKSEGSVDGKDWKEDGDKLTNSDDDIESDNEDDEDEKYNSGFSDIDVTDEQDPFKTDDDLDSDTSPIDFASADDFDESFDDEDEEIVPAVDDFETVEVSDDDDDEEDEDDDDYDLGEDDFLGKKK